MTVHTPGGFEQMHREVHAAVAAAAGALTAPDIIPMAQGCDWMFAGPPLLPLGELAMAARAAQ